MTAEPAPTPGPPAEAVLIRRARQARGMSPEDAATLTTVIKARRWRQVESGHDGDRRAIADDDVIAHMAAVVGLDPEQLARAGRAEAAEVLREIRRQAQAREDPALRIEPGEVPQVRAFLEGLRAGGRPGAAPVSPECDHERRIMRGPAPEDVKRLQVLAHREEGHDASCHPDAGVSRLRVPARSRR